MGEIADESVRLTLFWRASVTGDQQALTAHRRKDGGVGTWIVDTCRREHETIRTERKKDKKAYENSKIM